MAGQLARELPLRITVDEDGTPAIRCLCGAEAAASKAAGKLTVDSSGAAIVRMVMHARTCTAVQERLL